MKELQIPKGLVDYSNSSLYVSVIQVETCQLRLVTQACSTRVLFIKICLDMFVMNSIRTWKN